MNSIDPVLVVGVLIILAFVLNIVTNIIKTISITKRKPSVDTDIGTITTKLNHLQDEVARKQDANLCGQIQRDLCANMAKIEKRHANFESKMSGQVSDIHDRIDDQTKVASANGAKLDMVINMLK